MDEDTEQLSWRNNFDLSYRNRVLVLIRCLSNFLRKLKTGVVFQASAMIAPLEFSENLICCRYEADKQLWRRKCFNLRSASWSSEAVYMAVRFSTNFESVLFCFCKWWYTVIQQHIYICLREISSTKILWWNEKIFLSVRFQATEVNKICGIMLSINIRASRTDNVL